MTKLEYLQKMGIDVWVPRVTNTTPAESLLLFFVNYGELGICCSVRPQEATMPKGVRRICDDVAYAVLRKLTKPLLVCDQRFSSADSARARELVQENMEKLPENIVVFGEMFAHYVLDVEDIDVSGVVQQQKQKILIVDDIQSTIGDSEVKKTLWSNLNKSNFIHGYSRA